MSGQGHDCSAEEKKGRTMCWLTLRGFVLFSTCCLLGCGGDTPDVAVKFIGASDSNNARLWIISRGENDGRLAFAVFEGWARTNVNPKSTVSGTTNANNDKRTTVVVERPDGTKLKLPGDVKLVEIIDGQYKESRQEFSLEDLDGFIASKPEAFTIDNLVRFAAAKKMPR